MKTKLLLNLFLLTFIFGYSQSVRITSIIEGDCPSDGSIAPRVVELYVDGTVDVTNLKLQCQFAFADNWILNNNIGAGEYTNTFLYVINDADVFDANFSGIRTAENTAIGTIIGSVEGGDKIRLVDISDNNKVIDIFGVDGENGENQSWNYSNSYAARKNGEGPNATFDESEWDIEEKNSLLFKGACWQDGGLLSNIITLQKYTNTLSNSSFNVNDKISIYPNPTSSKISVSGKLINTSYSIYSILGQEVNKGSFNKTQSIDVSNLKQGVYLIKLENEKVFKFIKN